MNIANITFQYDLDKNVTGYIIYVDGKIGAVQTFSGQVNLGAHELDLGFIADQVQEKIAEIFSAQEEE
ncbi:hypothetical protein ACOJB1_12600 [Enterococcus innesii]|uniref:hypothetical protein n=1 Tax=Enterococcus innesii TaxID=2839759 RepID=UPI003B59DF69